MPLKIITGRAKSGKGREITRLAAENDGLLIVPETHSLSAEKALLTHCPVLGSGSAEVLSFARLAHTFSDNGPLGGRSIDPCGKIMALYLICIKNKDNFKAFGKSALKPGFSEKMLALIQELKRYGVDPETIENAAGKLEVGNLLTDKLSDIALIYKAYSEFIAAGYTDSDDDLVRLYDHLVSSRPYVGRHIYIDRFSSFTSSEIKIIGALLSQAASVTISLCTDERDTSFCFVPASETCNLLEKEAEKMGESVSYVHLTAPDEGELSHLEKNYFSYSLSPYNFETEHIFLYEAESVYSEVYRTARKILSLVKSGEADFSDISVICRTSEDYAHQIKSIFSSCSIPVTDTEAMSASDHPLFIYITSAIEASLSPSSLSPFLRYLKSGFSHIEPEDADILENYIWESGIYPSQFFSDEPLTYRADIYKGSRTDEALLPRLNETRLNALSPLKPLRSALKGRITARDFCRAVYSFFEETNLPEKVISLSQSLRSHGETDRAEMTEGVYNAIINALDSLCESAKDEVLSASSFLSVFSEGLTSVKGKIIPSSVAAVNFSGASRFKGAKSPIVFILGLNMGIFPKIPENNGLFTDDDKKRLSALGISTAPDSEHLNYEEQALLYHVLNSAEKKLFLSYPKKNSEGGSMTPSSVVKRVRALFPKISFSSDEDEVPYDEVLSSDSAALHLMLDKLNSYYKGEEIDDLYFRLYGYFKEQGKHLPRIPNAFSSMQYTTPLDKAITEKLFPKDFKTSISRLETYASCRFKYFMNYVLSARGRKTAAFSGGDIGSLLHLYAENVSSYLYDNSVSWHDVTENDIHSVLKKTTETVLESGSYYLKGTERALYLLKRLETLAFKMLLRIKSQFEYGDFIPLGSEIVFDDNSETGTINIPTPDGYVRLTGKVDRADILNTDEGNFVRIVDYKSGSKNFSFSEIYAGLNLQLSVYMLALTNDGKKPGAMLYFKFDDPIISDKKDSRRRSADDIEKEREDNFRMKGLISSNSEFLKNAEPNLKIKEGDVSTISGKYYSATLASDPNFHALFARVKKVISSLAVEMKKGDFSISPKTGGHSPCEYCEFKSACSKAVTPKEIDKLTGNIWEIFENDMKSPEEGGKEQCN